MTYVKVTIASFVLRAVTLAFTLPTESPYLLTLESTEDNHISPRTPGIQYMKLFRSQNDVRVEDLLRKPVAESEKTMSLFYKLETNENKEGRNMWRVVALLPKDDRTKMPKDVTSKLDKRTVIYSAPPPAVPARREPPPLTGYGNTSVGRASSTSAASGDPLAASLTPGDRSTFGLAGRGSPHQHNGTPSSWTDKEADAIDTTSGSGSVEAAASTSPDALHGALTSRPVNNSNDLEFFWSWEAILLVVLPAAWLALLATLCFLTRSAPGNRLLQTLCPSPAPDDAHLGHGIGFIDGSPGMRRRMTQCGEIPAAVAGIKAPSTEQEEQQTTEACVGEENTIDFEGKEITGKGPSADGSWPLEGRQAGLGALDDYQRVLRKLSLIQEEVSP